MFCSGYTLSSSFLLSPFDGKCGPPRHLTQKPLKHNAEKETRKDFCGKTSHQLFPVVQVILHLGPLGCAGEHTLHYLDGQSLRNPSVFGPAEGLKISAQQCVIFCVISMGPPGMYISLWSHISVWRWQRDKCLCARSCRFSQEVP